MAVFPSTYPRARIEHRCNLCELPIPVGERYRRYAVADDGGAATLKEHMVCFDFMTDYCRGGAEWAYMPEALRDVVKEQGAEAVLQRWPALQLQVESVTREIRERRELEEQYRARIAAAVAEKGLDPTAAYDVRVLWKEGTDV